MKQDIRCGGVLAAIGAVAVMEGRRHRIGSLTQMEAGYFPVVLGVVLIALGVLIAAMAIRQRPAAQPVPTEIFTLPDWRGCSAIVAGVLCFIVFGAYFGLAPATFLCVFISALAIARPRCAAPSRSPRS